MNRVISISNLLARAGRRGAAERNRTRLSLMILAVVGVLLVVGLGATMSASSVEGILENSDRLAVFKRQVRWVAVGAAAMLATSRIPYSKYRAAALPVLIASASGLLLVLALGVIRGGARRWIEVGSITVQPSEIAKLGMVVFLAAALTGLGDRISDLKALAAPVLASVGLICLLVVLQPDLGTTIVIAVTGWGMILAAGAPARYVAGGALLGAGAMALLAVVSPYRRARLGCFLDPLSDPLGDCFQLTQSLMALGSGNLFGLGVGASRARWAYLPNAHTDFIFSIIAEELGFIGAVTLLTFFAALVVIGVVIASRTSDPFARLLALGITVWLSVQAIINVGGVVGVIPVTGLALPFVSVGGTAMLSSMAAMGVLINIAHTAPGVRSRQ